VSDIVLFAASIAIRTAVITVVAAVVAAIVCQCSVRCFGYTAIHLCEWGMYARSWALYVVLVLIPTLIVSDLIDIVFPLLIWSVQK
jgi:hypothetical protein